MCPDKFGGGEVGHLGNNLADICDPNIDYMIGSSITDDICIWVHSSDSRLSLVVDSCL